MIARIWHGYTSIENAPVYEALLKTEIFPGIEGRKIDGYRRISLYRRTIGKEVEFVTTMLFNSIEDVKRFSGEDYEAAIVPEKARKILLRFDQRSQHYEIIANLEIDVF
jgi:hypothetical protein